MSSPTPRTPGAENGLEKYTSVSIVIPTHNNIRLLLQCLLAVKQLRYPQSSIEVVVVDNASSDGTGQTLSQRHEGVKHVRLEENLGFAAACSKGAAAANGEYVAFLNDDAIPEPGWLEGLFSALRAGGEGTECAASHIRSRDGSEIEFSGASANLFGVGKPRSAWGWSDSLDTPTEGSPILFASGGAMLIRRRVFLDAGGFDPNFFAYFEDVDLGWRLWLLGHKVVYAPNSVVKHIGGATGTKLGAHRRYTLWECNALAVVVKNYESGNMERVLSAALMLEYKRALLSAGDAIDPAEYKLGAGKDTNETNVERISKVSVAHLAAINRFNRLLPHFMEERARIQAARMRTDSEILPLLGRAYEPQFAGTEYAAAARELAHAMRLYGLAGGAAPVRVAVIAPPTQRREALSIAQKIGGVAHVAVAFLSPGAKGAETTGPAVQNGVALHHLDESDPTLVSLLDQADALIVLQGAGAAEQIRKSGTPTAYIGQSGAGTGARSYLADDPALLDFCRSPRA